MRYPPSDLDSYLTLVPSFATPNSKQLQTSSEVLKNTKEILAGCPTDYYVFATQPGMNAADLRNNDGGDMPSLHKSATVDKRVQGRYIVSEVVGDVADGNLAAYVKSACSKRGKQVTIEQVSLGQLPQDDRNSALQSNGTDSLTFSNGAKLTFCR